MDRGVSVSLGNLGQIAILALVFPILTRILHKIF
jgi:hypothetical protein